MRPSLREGRIVWAWAFLALALSASFPSGAAQTGLKAVGSEFVLVLPNGGELRGAALVGTRLTLEAKGEEEEVLFEGAERIMATGGPVWLYRLTVVDPSGVKRDLCQPDSQGRSVGFPIPADDGGFSFTCTSGAEGKCVLLGYRPWSGGLLRDLHKACIHLIRADYGGDGTPHTRDGTLIDVYDNLGIQTPSAPDPRAPMTFEAAWGVEGAICVARPRIESLASLEDLGRHYARLKDRLGPTTCTEEAMRANPKALLFNRSHPSR